MEKAENSEAASIILTNSSRQILMGNHISVMIVCNGNTSLN